MTEMFYHGRGYNGLRNIAEEGVIKGFSVDEQDVFSRMRPEINFHGKEDAIWVTDSVDCAKAYSWGGGYLEINPENVKVTEDDNSCYSVIMRDELPLSHVDRIMLEQREGDPENPRPDLGLEIANLLSEEHRDIKIAYYEPENYEVD